MAKSTLTGGMKFKALVRALGMPAPHVLGHLEFMWKPAYESGNPTFRSHEMIELAAEWIGEPGVFAKAVCNPYHNFVDERSDGLFEIHDFYEHAPDYVKKRIDREKLRKAQVVKRRRVKTYSGGQRQTLADNGGKSLPDKTNRTEPNRTETNPTQPNQAEPNRTEAEAYRTKSAAPSSAPTGTGSACLRKQDSRQNGAEAIVARFAALEQNPTPQKQTFWRARVQAMARLPGGAVRCDEILNEVESRRNPKVARTKGYSEDVIQNESAWANQQTQGWLREHGEE